MKRIGRLTQALLFVAVFALPGFAATRLNTGCTPLAVARISGPVEDGVRTALPGNVHPLARAEFDQGRVDDSLPMEHIIMMLRRAPEQELALQTRIDQMHNRRSPLYLQWLSAEQVGSCYGVADTDISAVVAWLQTYGFRIDSIPAGKMLVMFTGTAGQVRQAFHTEIHNLVVHGEKHIANMSAPQIPAALGPVVAGFRSLHNFFPKPMLHVVGPVKRDARTGKSYPVTPQTSLRNPLAKRKGTNPDISYPADDYYAVGPQDFYTIYNENPLLAASINGAGQTIAVLEETDVCMGQSGTTPNDCAGANDLTPFRSQFGLPAYPVPPNSTQGGVHYLFGTTGSGCTDPGVQGSNGTYEESEADVDLQWAGTVAPNAIIDFISCATTTTTAGVDIAATNLVNLFAGTVSAASLSYGVCEAQLDGSGVFGANAFYNTTWEQAVAEGITVVVSAGDSGDDTCDNGSTSGTSGVSVNGIASTPFNVAAGGTDFTDTYQQDNANPTTYWNSNDTSPYGSALSYIPEKAWNDSCGSNILLDYIRYFYGVTYTNGTEGACNDTTNFSTDYPFTYLDGGGGGVSAIYAIPTWQSVYGVGQASNFTSTSMRNLPDVSLFASDGFWNHLLVFCQSDAETGTGGGTPCDYTVDPVTTNMAAGGTSFVAPQLAGLMALINQANPSGSPGQPTRQGQPNYTLYALATSEYGTKTAENTSTTKPSPLTCESNFQAITKYSGVFPSCIFYDINRTPTYSPTNTTICVGATSTDCIVENIDQPCTASSTNCFTNTTGDTYGLLSTSTSTLNIAFPQSAGYDAATGLGSVNITNLVQNWRKVTPQFASTTTLAADPVIVGVSGTTTLTATITATGRGSVAPPLGTVTFYTGTSCTGTTLGTAALVPASGCTTTCNATASLAGVTGTQLGGIGSRSAIACFSGDGANDAPSSGSATLTVKTSASIALTSSLNPSISGQAVTFTATVTSSGSPAPTGAVSFTSLGSAITGCTSVALSSHTATCDTSTLAVGTDAIVAAYSGDSNYAGTNSTLSQLVNPVATAVQFVPVTPCRVVDTRGDYGDFGGPELTTGETRSFAIPSGPCTGIPTTAVAYSLNVTVVPPGPLGYLTIWPTGEGQPTVSTLNSLDGRIKANAAIVPAGTSGSVSVFVNNTSNVLLDINGYFESSTSSSLKFYPLTPCRVADTRKATGSLGGPSLVAGKERDFPILSSTCSIPSTAKAYSLNFTVIPPTGGTLSYLTVWPEGQTKPLVSTLNDLTGTIVANAAIVPAGTGGGVAVYPSDATNLVIDVNGYFAPPATGGLQLYPLTPCRVLDTRKTTGAFSNTTLVVNVAGSQCEPPSTAQAYVFNATVVPTGDLGYLTLWPDGETQPVVSTLNAADGAITSNMAIVPSKDGKTDAYASGTTQLVLDISGYFAP